MTVGEKIKAARKRAGLTQKQLAERLDFSYVNISQVESGQRIPGLPTLQRIAKALNIPAQELVADWNDVSVEDGIDLLIYGGQISRVAENMRQLTVTARDKVEEYSKDMLRIPGNRLENVPPPSPEGKDTTPAADQEDG